MVIRSLVNFYVINGYPFFSCLEFSKTKETEIEKRIVDVLQQASDHKKKTGKQKMNTAKF